MERYIAFLRGINVSGQKIIRMENLRSVMADTGFTDVKTYIQSGNIVFSSDIQNIEFLIVKIENGIEEAFGFHTDVIIRRFADIETLLNSTFFDLIQSSAGKKHYITFLKNEYQGELDFPVFSKNNDIEIIRQNKMDFFSLSSIYKGNYGFPNSFIEKLTGIPATTRNPNTLVKIMSI